MQIEIPNPELVQRVNAYIRPGRYHNADELPQEALDALDEPTPPRAAARTGADIFAA